MVNYLRDMSGTMATDSECRRGQDHSDGDL